VTETGATAAVPSPGASPEKPYRWKMTPVRWLMVAIAAFFAVSFALSWLRAVEFQTSTWDQGVYQQALWMTSHGRPFYETPDVETGGYGSLLQVHSVFLFYLLVPLYAALPYQTTLFAVQSAVVAFAAVPLYFLGRDLSASPRLGLATGFVYLAFTPVLSSTLYDFHPETFLPVELFTVALLWERGRYRWGVLAATVAFCTMELAPVLIFFVGLFGLLMAESSRSAALGLPIDRGWPGRVMVWLREWFRRPRVRASLGLMAASAAAYVALLYLRVDILTSVLGTYPLPAPATGYVIGATPASLQLSLGNLAVGITAKLTYWLLALALLAFIPLFAPRALVLAVPWFTFTLLSANLNYTTLGFQYGCIAASSLLIAFAYGLPEARRFAIWARSRFFRREGIPQLSAPGSRGVRSRQVALIAGLAVLLATNVALTPVDPVMDSHGLGSAYRLTYSPNPGDSQVDQLAGLVPRGATVIASDNLFPLVANDANAYSFAYVNDPGLNLPFSPAHLPTYVLVAEDSSPSVTPWIAEMLYNVSAYGLRGVVWSSGPGVVLLFEVGYLGPPREFGTPPSASGAYYGSSVVAPEAGVVTTASNAYYASVVESRPGAVGVVWNGPAVNLASGSYLVELSLRATVLPGQSTPGPSTPVVSVSGSAFGLSGVLDSNLTFGSLSDPGWHIVSYNVTLPGPSMEFGVEGVLLDSGVQVTLNYLSIALAQPTWTAEEIDR